MKFTLSMTIFSMKMLKLKSDDTENGTQMCQLKWANASSANTISKTTIFEMFAQMWCSHEFALINGWIQNCAFCVRETLFSRSMWLQNTSETKFPAAISHAGTFQIIIVVKKNSTFINLWIKTTFFNFKLWAEFQNNMIRSHGEQLLQHYSFANNFRNSS